MARTNHENELFKQKADEILRTFQEAEQRAKEVKEAEEARKQAELRAKLERDAVRLQIRDIPDGPGAWSAEQEARFMAEFNARMDRQIAGWQASARREKDARIAGMSCGIVSIL